MLTTIAGSLLVRGSMFGSLRPRHWAMPPPAKSVDRGRGSGGLWTTAGPTGSPSTLALEQLLLLGLTAVVLKGLLGKGGTMTLTIADWARPGLLTSAPELLRSSVRPGRPPGGQ